MGEVRCRQDRLLSKPAYRLGNLALPPGEPFGHWALSTLLLVAPQPHRKLSIGVRAFHREQRLNRLLAFRPQSELPYLSGSEGKSGTLPPNSPSRVQTAFAPASSLCAAGLRRFESSKKIVPDSISALQYEGQ